MQSLARTIQTHGKVVQAGILRHVRVLQTPGISSQQCRHESAKPATLEEGGFESTTIADVLKAKGKGAEGEWLFCTTDDTVYDAVKSMTNHNVGALLVVKPGTEAQIAGIITERDYLRKIIVQGRSSKTTRVGDIMTEENKLITVTPETRVLHAMQMMTEKRIRHIPVVKDKQMKGMVSIGDVVRAVVEEHREELKRLNTYIQGDTEATVEATVCLSIICMVNLYSTISRKKIIKMHQLLSAKDKNKLNLGIIREP